MTDKQPEAMATGAAYAALHDGVATLCEYGGDVFTAAQMRAFADATHALRVESLAAAYCEELDKLSKRNYELRLASHGQAPAQAALGAAYDFRDAHISGSMNLKRSAHAELETAPAQPSDPHAELRKAWTPGHKWQWTSAAEEGRWWSHNGEPEWNPEWRYRLAPARPVAEPGAAYAALPESLTLAVNLWFADNTGLDGCSDKDVRDLAALFYGVTHGGGRESVDDALAIVESFGPGIGGLNDTYARQILLANEVKRLRASHGQAPASVLHLVHSAFAEIAMAFPKAFALHKVGIADTAVREALAAPAAVAGADEIDRLRAALVYVAFALHDTRQYMLAEGITLIDGDTVRVSRDGWTVEASSNPLRQPEPKPSPAAQGDVSAAGGDSFLLLPTRPTPDAPANTAGLSWDAYSGAQMLAYGRSCSDAALVVAAHQPSPAAQGDALSDDAVRVLPETCEWTATDAFDQTYWDSACGEAWTFIDGGPADNSVRFCQGCGKPVHIKQGGQHGVDRL